MPDGGTNGNGKKVERIVESIGAKAFARIVTPLLLAVMGYLGIEVRADIRTALDKLHSVTVQLAVLQAEKADLARRIERLETRP